MNSSRKARTKTAWSKAVVTLWVFTVLCGLVWVIDSWLLRTTDGLELEMQCCLELISDVGWWSRFPVFFEWMWFLWMDVVHWCQKMIPFRTTNPNSSRVGVWVSVAACRMKPRYSGGGRTCVTLGTDYRRGVGFDYRGLSQGSSILGDAIRSNSLTNSSFLFLKLWVCHFKADFLDNHIRKLKIRQSRWPFDIFTLSILK